MWRDSETELTCDGDDENDGDEEEASAKCQKRADQAGGGLGDPPIHGDS